MSSEDYSLFDYPSEREEDLQPLWTPEKSKPATQPKVGIVGGVVPPPLGSCEFVGGLPYQGALCRKCTLGSVCFLFANPLAYASCPDRTEKLRELRELRKLKEQT